MKKEGKRTLINDTELPQHLTIRVWGILDQPWDFFGRHDAKAETPVLWPLHAKSWLIGKDCDAGRDWGQEEEGTTEDEMAGWHNWLDGRESEWTPGVGDGQGGLACCDSWGRKESDTTERLNWTELNWRRTKGPLLFWVCGWSSAQKPHCHPSCLPLQQYKRCSLTSYLFPILSFFTWTAVYLCVHWSFLCVQQSHKCFIYIAETFHKSSLIFGIMFTFQMKE